jgi:hypothetical protein
MAEWTPVLAYPLLAKGSYQLTSRSYVLKQSLIILHIRMSSIDPGGPLAIINQYLQPFLGDRLSYHEISFDLSSEQGEHDHTVAAEQLADNLAA